MQIKPHILLAEDDADTRDLLQVILLQAGFRVSCTSNPTEVMHLLATDNVDVLLLDNWMPGVTGIELCRRIRSVHITTPIFFCSGAVTDADKKAAFSAGAQGYLAKPFDPGELTATVRAALMVVDSAAL